jgi:hypothetical protein
MFHEIYIISRNKLKKENTMMYSIYKCVECDTIYEEEPKKCIVCHHADFMKQEFSLKPIVFLCDCGFLGFLKRNNRCPRCGRDTVRRVDDKIYIKRMIRDYYKDRIHLAKDQGYFNAISRKPKSLKPLDDIINMIDKSNNPVVEEITKKEMEFIDQVPLPKMNMQTCGCGCGKIILSGAKFLKGHYIRKKKGER